MDRTYLLEAMKVRQEHDTADLLMPTKPQKGVESVERAPEIFTYRVPDRQSETTKAPYAVNMVLNSTFRQLPGEEPEGLCTIRTVFCVYNERHDEGEKMLLNMMERIRISYQKNPILDARYELDMETGIQDVVYPDDTAPFYLGEMITVWKLPPVKREVRAWL
jgi:hypothetical protein